MKSKFRTISIVIAIALIVGGIGLGLTAAYQRSPARTIPLVFSNNAMLHELWVTYKATYIEEGSGRTVDRQQNNITTSEGQSYTMIRAVYSDDKTVFDSSWKWTQDNLQRDDKLFSWRYGPRADGSYGIQTDQGGNNTASDGDIDIALGLLLAYSKWGDPQYLNDAKEIIPAIYQKEVITVSGKPVLMSNDIERNSATNVVVNPSYFAPYAFKTFAKIDPTNNWTGLSDNSYTVLQQMSTLKLGAANPTGLPPNWVILNRVTGEYSAPAAGSNLDTNYGYDAYRTTFRLALDYAWFKDPRAKEVLENYSFLKTTYQKEGQLTAIYNRDGQPISDYQTPAMYGTAIGYFTVVDPAAGKEFYRQKLQTLYSPDTQTWANTLSYYDDNWAWFGIALSQDALPNLTEQN